MKAWSLSSSITIAAVASRHHVWSEIALSCLDGSNEHTFDLGLFQLMTWTASLFKAHDIQKPTARRGPKILFQKPEFQVTLMTCWPGWRWFPPMVSLFEVHLCAAVPKVAWVDREAGGGDRREQGWGVMSPWLVSCAQSGIWPRSYFVLAQIFNF